MQKTYKRTTSGGSTYYYKDEARTIFHRIDGPAIELSDGYKAWYVNGKRHRLDGPAIEYANGTKAWYVNDWALCSVNNQGEIVDRMYEL